MRERAIAGFAGILLLASCGHAPSPQASVVSPAVSPAVCRVGPDGGPPLADRGIGGTGAPVLADRGISGTGSPKVASRVADRGIGGTGVVGVITGFASICLAGQEIALPTDAPIFVETPALADAEPADPAILRAGQVAVVEAAPAGDGLVAQRVQIRYEAVGPVEHATGNRLQVVGQEVAITPQTLGTLPREGDWVAVSGLRGPDGVILATRLDPGQPGLVQVHGVLQANTLGFGALRVGALAVATSPQLVALVGQPITLFGTIADAQLTTSMVVPDLLAANPGAYFGPSVRTVLIEGYGAFSDGRLRLGSGFSAPSAGLHVDLSRNVFRFERASNGLRAVAALRAPASIPSPPLPRFDPAPVPNRSISPGRSGFGDGGHGSGPRGNTSLRPPGSGAGDTRGRIIDPIFSPGGMTGPNPGAARDGPPGR